MRSEVAALEVERQHYQDGQVFKKLQHHVLEHQYYPKHKYTLEYFMDGTSLYLQVQHVPVGFVQRRRNVLSLQLRRYVPQLRLVSDQGKKRQMSYLNTMAAHI